MTSEKPQIGVES